MHGGVGVDWERDDNRTLCALIHFAHSLHGVFTMHGTALLNLCMSWLIFLSLYVTMSVVKFI